MIEDSPSFGKMIKIKNKKFKKIKKKKKKKKI